MSEPNAFEKFMNWASSNPLVQGAANFLSDPIGNIKNVGYDIKSTFGGYDPREAHFTITDDNGTEHEYDFGSGGYIYKTPSGEHTSHRGYAYLNVGNDGRLKLNVSKSVAESDWFKTQFTENDTFKKVIKMFNANPASNTTLTTTDKDGNVKNITLAEALKQYNDALGEYASNYEGISYLRDYYKNNTGLTLTDDQIRISESTINRDEDSKNESKVIYIPDSWNAIYDFKQLPSWNGDTKTVSAKDFFDVYNLDEKGSITEEQWNALSDAAEAELENAFSGRVAKNLNTEDPEAIKSAGDKLAKAIAASKTINGSKPDVSGVHATGIFLSSLGEQFTSSLSNTYGNIGEFIVAQGEWLANSPVAPISWAGERIEDAVFLTNTPANAVLVAMGAIGEDIANGRITPGIASDYVAEIRDSLEELWSSTHGDMSYKEYHNPIFGGHSINEITETFDKDISYMEKISKAAAGGKFVGNLLELGVEVWVTEMTGTAAGKALETTGMNIGRGLGLAFKGSKIKDQASIVTKLYMAANKATAFTGNMMVQGFLDTIESDAGALAAKLLSSGELSEQEKQELTAAMTANTLYNIGGEMVVGKLVPKFLETKPGRFVQTRAQKAVAAASLPFKKGQIGFAKLINGVVNGKTPTKAMEDIAQKYAFSFGVNSLNEYNVKLAEANYAATKSIATAKEGKEYIDAITGNKLKASSTTQAIETTVMNKMYYQNMVDRISKGVRAEVNEIMKTPDVAKAASSSDKANTKVIEAETRAGKKTRTVETGDGAQIVVKAQDDTNYLIYKHRLDVMNNKEAALKAAKKTLSTSDEEFKRALESAVKGFEATNDPRLVAALNEYYLANLSLNKALTDWEVQHGLMSKETYESLKKTGFFGLDDELYMKTMRLNPKGPNVTDDYMDAVVNYANNYYKTTRESYRVNPVYESDQHVARFFDPEANYIDTQLANFARVNAMALAYQANNWGKALKGIGMPMEEMDTLGKATSHKEVTEAMSSAKKVAATAVENLKVDELQPVLSSEGIVTLGESEYEGYKLEDRIKDTEGKIARKLGIADNDQVSRNVKMLSDEQIVSTIDAIPESPAYGAVKNYDEFTAMQDGIPTKEMKAKAEKMMNTQISEYDNGFKAKTKEFEAQKKERLAQATTLEKEASSIDKEVARIEKANASGQAKYEKAKASAEKKIKAAEEKAKKATAKAQKAGGAETAEKQLREDMRDAILYRSGVDIDDGFFPYDIAEVPSMFKESRMDQLDEIKIKNGVDLKNLSKTKKMPKPEDIFEKEYIDSVRAKYATPEPAAQPVSTPEIKMPDPFVPTDTADKVAEAAAKREEATRIRGEVDSLKAPRSLSDKQKAVKAWNDAVKKTDMVNDLNKMWLQDAITNKGVEIPEGVMAYIKDQIANAKLAEHTEIDLIDSLVMRSKNPAKTAESVEKWLDEYNKLDEDLQKMKELLNLKGEGTDPFTRASENILDTITEKTGKILSGNPASKRIIEMAKEQGVDTELVKEYLSINALLRENGNGDLVLRDDVQKAIKERLLKEMYVQKGNEGNLTPGMQEKVIKDFQGIAQETAKSKWAIAQEKLTSAGGNDFVDVERSFNQVKKEMETFVGQFNSTNVVPMMNANGELKYYKVSPLVADIYMNRPVASYGKLSDWFNKVSRISRVSKTTLNATSVINQCFRDPLNAYIGAGMYKGFRAYEKEMAEIFGPELVAQLQDSMSKAGWDAFTEGGKISGSELQRKAARYVVEDSGVNTFAKETTENALFESRRTALRGARMGALDNLDVWNKHYKKAKISLNEFVDKFQKVAGAPGYIINESRELFLRKADYASALNTALRQGKTMLEAKNIAEFVSRHATTNFGRTFMWGNSIVNATPFLGAAINGSASFWRLAAMDPVGVFSRFITAGMATMSIVAQSMTTKRDRDVYKTIPEWMKQENIVFVYDGEVFKIPIPQEMGALLAPFRQAVEKTNPGVQSHAWLELLGNDMLELSPISLDGLETLDEVNLDGDPTFFDRMSREFSALISQVAPPLIKTAYMAQVGVDPYTGNPIDTSYKWIDSDGNIQIMDNTQSSFANFISDKLDWFGEKKSASFWYKTMDSFFGTGLMNIADGVTNIFSGDVVGGTAGFVGAQLEKGLNAVNVRDYQLQDPYLREFKATIKELEGEKNKLLAPDGELALLSQKMSMLSPTDAKYDELKKRYIQQYNQITEDYRQRVLSTVQNYNNNYGSTYTINQFAAVTNLLVFQESTLMPLNAYQDEQLSQMYYSAREQAYQTMIDMGFDSPDDWSIFGVARRNKDTGEVYIKYASPTAILNMDNVAMGAGRVYSAELESALKNAGLTKSERYKRYAEANAKGKKAVKAFKQEWNAEVAQAIADTMNKYGASNVINSGDATSLLNEYFYISNTSYKVKDYLEDVFGKED